MPDRRHVALMILGLCSLGLVAGTACGKSEAVPPAEYPLIVASFNVWGIPGVSDQWDERRTKIPAALRALNVDIICLQEVWIPAHQRELAAAMKSTHPHVAHATGGLMLLSRWPILSQMFEKYPRYAELSFAERMAGKGHLTTQVQSPAGILRVVNTHLTWAPGANPARTKQLGVLLEHIKQYAKEPLLVLGDFNTPTLDTVLRVHPQFERVLKSGLASTDPPKRDKTELRYVVHANTRPIWPRTEAGWTGWDPDHIFCRSTDELKITVKSFSVHFTGLEGLMSDHNLVRATLLLTPKPESAAK